MSEDYASILVALQYSDIAVLEEIAQLVADFPHGKDSVTGRFWVMNAIDRG